MTGFLSSKGLSLRKMDDNHYVDFFSCGRDDKMDRWLSDTALKWQREDMCAVWVLSPASDDTDVWGFFTLSAHQIIPSNVAKTDKAFVGSNREWVYNLNNPFPAQLLGKFALDRGHQGRGLGEVLMLCAYAKHVEAADIAGSKFLVLDVRDDKLVSYYQDRYGFVRSSRVNGGAQMYRPTWVIRKELEEALA
ncbi:hypothetical protein DRB06_03505 [Actinomyces sp. Z5]|nr:hypothetical protein DRB06_03505 [Actinomyces sp. Z5]RAX23422.1 hypothetical protein DRB07_04355 [Actinomyces sp. Z3]